MHSRQAITFPALDFPKKLTNILVIGNVNNVGNVGFATVDYALVGDVGRGTTVTDAIIRKDKTSHGLFSFGRLPNLDAHLHTRKRLTEKMKKKTN